MFKHILIILLILTLVYFIIKYFKFKLHLDHNVKYQVHYKDTGYLDKYSESANLFDVSPLCVFYTTKSWSTKNNNYLKHNDRYYIIEPGYYYYIHPETEMFLNNNYKVKILKIK